MIRLSYYRIYEYPSGTIPYKHVYIKRDREVVKDDPGKSILECLDREGKFQESLSRSRRVIRDLILCNGFEYFCTFTFSPEHVDRFDYNACKKRLTKFFNNFRSRYAPEFRYLIIPEFHQDGAIHFHGVVRGFPDGELVKPEMIFKRNRAGELLSVPNTPGYLDWPRYHENLGLFNCSRIRNYDACAFYVTKYVTKELCKMPLGRSVYMASKGLNRPELVFDEDGVPMMFDPEFENEFCCVAFEKLEDTEDYIYAPPPSEWWHCAPDELEVVGFYAADGEQLPLSSI